MSAFAAYTRGVEMAAEGFTSEDRKRFERLFYQMEDVWKRYEEVKQRVQDVEVDLDGLRDSKADKDELSASIVRDQHTRMALIEKAQVDIATAVSKIEVALEPLKAWRWKELGAVGAIVGLAEFVFHVLVK